jgi:hypothetical protein
MTDAQLILQFRRDQVVELLSECEVEGDADDHGCLVEAVGLANAVGNLGGRTHEGVRMSVRVNPGKPKGPPR